MTELRKARIKTVMKYTWPIYIVSAILVALLLNFIFGITHKTPVYKTLTLFVSGEVDDPNKFEKDLMDKYQDKELKSVTVISSNINDGSYNTRLSVAGYNTADILVIPTSKLDSIVVSAFSLDLKEELINSYYQGYTFYEQESVKYGVKLNKEVVKDYMSLPNEDCYMVLNAKSETIGEYSSSQIKERDLSLQIVKDWGM